MSKSDDAIMRRAFAAYFRSGGGEQPAGGSGVVRAGGLDYVRLLNPAGELLAVYRIDTVGRLKRLRRPPKELGAPTTDSEAPTHTVGAAYQRFVEADDARRTANTSPQLKAAWREKWEATRDVLSLYLKSDDFPGEVALFLRDTIDQRLAGAPSPGLDALNRAGAPATPPVVQGLIRDAMLYVRAVERKLVVDKKPQQTIRDAFDIGLDTYRAWRRNRNDAALDADLAKMGLVGKPDGHEPKPLREERERRATLAAGRIERRMRFAGRGYQRIQSGKRRKR